MWNPNAGILVSSNFLRIRHLLFGFLSVRSVVSSSFIANFSPEGKIMPKRKNQRRKPRQPPKVERVEESVIDIAVKIEPEDDEVVEVEEVVAEINKLPDVVIHHMFSFFNYGDKLWARMVCKRWNELMTGYGAFLRNSIIRVSPIESEGLSILEKSSVPWVNVHLKDLRSADRKLVIVIPNPMQDHVKTLKISNAQLTWKGFKQVLVQFPKLESLKLQNLRITDLHGSKMPVEKATNLTTEFKAVLNKIKSLNLSQCSVRILQFLCHKFKLSLLSMTTLAVKNFDCGIGFLFTRKDAEELTKGLYELIENSAGTLKHLTITKLRHEGEEVQDVILQNVIAKLGKSSTTHGSLQLESLELDAGNIDPKILLQFLQMCRATLKKFRCLPSPKAYPPQDNENGLPEVMMKKLLAVIPTNVEHLCIPHKKYMDALGESLFAKFPNLRELELGETGNAIRPKVLGLSPANIKRNLQKILQVLVRNSRDVKLIGNLFPNIVHLNVTINTSSCTAAILSRLSKELLHLTTLKLRLENESELDDAGLTGITESYCFVLGAFHKTTLKTKTIPEREILFSPLCSLRRLEELEIIGNNMQITDVGLCFGFRFANLKRLRITNTGEMTQVTLAGLNFLADFNPSLEELYLDRLFCVEFLPSLDWASEQFNGLAQFKERLTRCKKFRNTVLTFPGHVKQEEDTGLSDSDQSSASLSSLTSLSDDSSSSSSLNSISSDDSNSELFGWD